MDASDLTILFRALSFAAHKHRHQRRKDEQGAPYINHPIAVARLLCEHAGVVDTGILCAALLHDTLEDTDTTPEELDAAFGADIRRIVMEVTDDKRLPESVRKRLQVQRAGNLSQGGKLIKLADKICNLRDVVERPAVGWDLQRRQEYFDWAQEVVDRLRGVDSLLEDLFDAAYSCRPR
jgi:guanosine-3',5'-bis(diphosphate) 3'-pyrophosphohydrolase